MEISELVRDAMRRWVSGVTVVTSRVGDIRHGMTVNSFTSISLDPPLVSLALANRTRTYGLVEQSGILAITFLGQEHQELSDRFAGKIAEDADRFAGLDLFEMVSGAPLILIGRAFMDCRVVFSYPMPTSTLLIAEVLAVQLGGQGLPLVYYNRGYPRLLI